MRQWFVGRFRGHYRGTPNEKSALSRYPDAPHFRIEVYEALVQDIALGPLIAEELERQPEERGQPSDAVDSRGSDTTPRTMSNHHHRPERKPLYQSHIAKVHLRAPFIEGQTIRGTVHDVLMSDLILSRPAASSQGLLGHVEGTMSGWFKPPPPPPPVVEVPARDGPSNVGWQSEFVTDEGALGSRPSSEPVLAAKDSVPQKKATAPRVRALGRPEFAAEKELAKGGFPFLPEPTFSPETTLHSEQSVRDYPFLAIGAGCVVVLSFFATPASAGLFAFTFFLSWALRRGLTGVIPEGSGTRALSFALSACPIAIAVTLFVRWSEMGCTSLSPAPIVLLVVVKLSSSLLPRPLPLLLAMLGFAAVLMQAYGIWAAPFCGGPG